MAFFYRENSSYGKISDEAALRQNLQFNSRCKNTASQSNLIKEGNYVLHSPHQKKPHASEPLTAGNSECFQGDKAEISPLSLFTYAHILSPNIPQYIHEGKEQGHLADKELR